MLNKIAENKYDFDLTSKRTLSGANDTFTSRSFAALLAKNNVPAFHKRIADNYLIIKKIFKFQACMSRISNVENFYKSGQFLMTKRLVRRQTTS